MEESSRRTSPKDNHLGDILIEVLEVAINLILYVRNIYPSGIFVQQKIYNTLVMISRHPGVNGYIKKVLESMRGYIKDGSIEKVVVEIAKDNVALERFVFEMKLPQHNNNNNNNSSNSSNNNSCFYDIETHLRAVILKMNTCDAKLRPLPENCTFNIQAHTKSSSLTKMENGPGFADFPWVVVENDDGDGGGGGGGDKLKDPAVIPIRSCNTDVLILQCYVEESSVKE